MAIKSGRKALICIISKTGELARTGIPDVMVLVAAARHSLSVSWLTIKFVSRWLWPWQWQWRWRRADNGHLNHRAGHLHPVHSATAAAQSATWPAMPATLFLLLACARSPVLCSSSGYNLYPETCSIQDATRYQNPKLKLLIVLQSLKWLRDRMLNRLHTFLVLSRIKPLVGITNMCGFILIDNSSTVQKK